MKNNFNIILSGIGGQGIITLTRILAAAAFLENYDVKTSELHGLSQRNGSVETHIRFGKKIYSPLVRQGSADLIIALEAQEALRACSYASKEQGTLFLINNFIQPILGNQQNASTQQIKKQLEKFSKMVIIVSASEPVKKYSDNPALFGVFMLGYAVCKKLIPLKADSFLKAIKKNVPEKYFKINQKIFKLAK